MRETRWDRPRIGIIVYLDLAMSFIGIIACRLTGLALMKVGLKLRKWIPPEIAHGAFLRTVRILYWQPKGWL